MSDIPTNPPEGSSNVPPTPPAGGAPLDYSPAASGVPTYAGPAPTPDDKTMGMLAHLLGIFGFIGPLIIWLIKKDQSPFVNDQGKEALNFHLMLLIGILIGSLTICLGIGLVIVPVVWVCGVVFSIIGCLKARDGIAYRYPFTIRFIK
jgi:hypothetical protein